MSDQNERVRGVLEHGERGGQHWLVVEKGEAAAAASPGDRLWLDDVEYVVTGRAGRRYRNLERYPRCWLVNLPVVPAGTAVPAQGAGAASAAQRVALARFGVEESRITAATAVRASDWLDELVIAAERERTVGAQGEVDEIRRRINQLGE